MPKTKRILPLSAIMPDKGVPIDTVKRRHQECGLKRNQKLMEAIEQDWTNMREMRERRERNFRFTFEENGQWSDPCKVFNYDTGRTETITEGEFIERQGMKPLENNLIRRIVTKYQGSFLEQKIEPIASARNPINKEAADMITLSLQANWQRSDNDIANQFQPAIADACCGGFIAAREVWEMTGDGTYDAMTYMINPNRLFFSSTMQDPLMRDMTRVGYIHDIPKIRLYKSFAKTRKDKEMLDDEYRICQSMLQQHYVQKGEENRLHNTNFRYPTNSNDCRVFEVWTLETKGRYYCWDKLTGEYFKCEEENISKVPLEKYGNTLEGENLARAQMAAEAGIAVEEIPLIDYGQFHSRPGIGLIYDEFWYVQYLTPLGTILYEAESPYACGCPITVALYPMVNGEVHPIVSDCISMQKNINRMLMLQDLIMKNAGKNVTFIDESSLLGDYTPEYIKQQLASPNGLIKYDSRQGERPVTQGGNPVSVGVEGIVSMYIQLMEDATGIHGASQGKEALSGQSAALYQQQSMASDTMMLPFVEWLNKFMRNIAIKKSKFIVQFYEDGRPINITGDESKGPAYFMQDKAQGLEYDISISRAAATAVATELSNQMAISLFQAGAFGIKPLLKSVNLPFAPALLRNIEEEEAKMAQAQQMGQQYTPQLNPNIVGEARQQLNQQQQEAAGKILEAP